MKDVPAQEVHKDLQIVCWMHRSFNDDALLSNSGKKFLDLPPGSKIGTSSIRRRAQILKLRKDLDLILENKKFNSPGVTHFGAISLNQIPGDVSSTEGHNVRGTYWTIPDETGKEAKRDKPIDESKYTELVQEFKGTYFEEVFNILISHFSYF